MWICGEFQGGIPPTNNTAAFHTYPRKSSSMESDPANPRRLCALLFALGRTNSCHLNTQSVRSRQNSNTHTLGQNTVIICFSTAPSLYLRRQPQTVRLLWVSCFGNLIDVPKCLNAKKIRVGNISDTLVRSLLRFDIEFFQNLHSFSLQFQSKPYDSKKVCFIQNFVTSYYFYRTSGFLILKRAIWLVKSRKPKVTMWPLPLLAVK